MRIERIRLDNFLGFASLERGFDAGLNVVLAPNEGGKSSLLRAIDAALYVDATSRSAEAKGLARWGSGELFRIELDLELRGERCRLVRDYRSREQEIRPGSGGEPAARGRGVAAYLAGRLPLDRDLFARVCAVRHEDLASIGQGPAGIGEKIEEILGGAAGGRPPAEVVRIVDEKRKDLNRGRDGRANRENWGALRRFSEETASLGEALGRAREIERRREELSRGIAAAQARLAEVERDLAVLDERRARAGKLRDLEAAERGTLERSRDLQERLERIRRLEAERVGVEETIARSPAFLARCDGAALDAIVADLEREAGLEREIERFPRRAANAPAWRLALGICLVAGGIAGAILWKTVLATAAAAGAALIAWHWLGRRASARGPREYAARELDALRGKRASWAGGSSREEAARLARATREARARLVGIAAGLEGACGAKGTCDGIVERFERELGDLALELRGARAEKKDLDAFRLDAGAILLAEREAGARAAERESLRAAIARTEGQLSALPEADAASIEERLEAAREDLERARRRTRMLDAIAEALGEARRRMSGTLAERLPALAAARLAEITGGRYGSLFFDPLTLAVDVAPAAADIATAPAAGSAPERVSPQSLSQGARDQLYLAVRLALIDLLGGVESLPVFLDDPFVHFDPERRERAIAMLRSFAGSHQVVLFTCDPAYRAIGGRLVELRR